MDANKRCSQQVAGSFEDLILRRACDAEMVLHIDHLEMAPRKSQAIKQMHARTNSLVVARYALKLQRTAYTRGQDNPLQPLFAHGLKAELIEPVRLSIATATCGFSRRSAPESGGSADVALPPSEHTEASANERRAESQGSVLPVIWIALSRGGRGGWSRLGGTQAHKRGSTAAGWQGVVRGMSPSASQCAL